jgi:anaerobic selenocysteine-containing dehydrogenase
MFKNGWINEEYVSKHVYGKDELQKKVEKYTPELVEKITGVPNKAANGSSGNHWNNEKSSIYLFAGSVSVKSSHRKRLSSQ